MAGFENGKRVERDGWLPSGLASLELVELSLEVLDLSLELLALSLGLLGLDTNFFAASFISRLRGSVHNNNTIVIVMYKSVCDDTQLPYLSTKSTTINGGHKSAQPFKHVTRASFIERWTKSSKLI